MGKEHKLENDKLNITQQLNHIIKLIETNNSINNCNNFKIRGW